MGNLIFRKQEAIRSYYDPEHLETSDYDIVLPETTYSAVLPNPINKDRTLKNDLDDINEALESLEENKQNKISGTAGRVVVFTNVPGQLAEYEKVNVVQLSSAASEDKIPSEKAVAAYHTDVILPEVQRIDGLTTRADGVDTAIDGLINKDNLIDEDLEELRGIINDNQTSITAELNTVSSTLGSRIDDIADGITAIGENLYGSDGSNLGDYLKDRLVGSGSVTITEDRTDPASAKLVIYSDGLDPDFITDLESELERVIAIRTV